MEFVAFALILVAGLVGSVPIQSGARGEVAEIEKKNFVPLPDLIRGTVLRSDGRGYPTGRRQQDSRFRQQYQRQRDQYGQQGQGMYNDEGGDCQCPQPQYQAYNPHYRVPQQSGIINFSKCPCRPNASGRPFYPYHALRQVEGAPNVIDLRHLLSGRMERPPQWPWGVRKAKPAAMLATQKQKPVYKPPPAAVKNGYGYTGWAKTGIPNPWGYRQQRVYYWG